MQKQRIYSIKNNSLSAEDRLEIAKGLLKAGYTVRLGRERTGKSSAYTYFIEYWEESDE